MKFRTRLSFFSAIHDDIFILTLFCFPKNVQSYYDKRTKCPHRKFTVKLSDSRYQRDSSRPKTNDKDKFQLGLQSTYSRVGMEAHDHQNMQFF